MISIIKHYNREPLTILVIKLQGKNNPVKTEIQKGTLFHVFQLEKNFYKNAE